MLPAGTEVLIYVPTNTDFPLVSGSTRIGTIVGTANIAGDLMYRVTIHNSENGSPTEYKAITSLDSILDSYRPEMGGTMYYIGDQVIASNYVDTTNHRNPCNSVMRYPMGSGVRGLAHTIRSTETIREIDSPYAYTIVDFPHYESICLASIFTNLHIDNIIRLVYENPHSDVGYFIDTIPVDNITTLWNIALSRSGHSISHQQLQAIYQEYVELFISPNHGLRDSITGNRVLPLPINYIITGLGFYGIIATDVKSNDINKGCVSYDYTIASQIRAGSYDMTNEHY